MRIGKSAERLQMEISVKVKSPLWLAELDLHGQANQPRSLTVGSDTKSGAESDLNRESWNVCAGRGLRSVKANPPVLQMGKLRSQSVRPDLETCSWLSFFN